MIFAEYCCDKCGSWTNNEKMESFTCECGGKFLYKNGRNIDVFEPYYDETLKTRISSAAQRDKEFRKAGLYVSQDDKKMIKRWSDTRKYKEEKYQEVMAKEGKSYKPGSGKVWSNAHQDFVPANTRS